MQVPGLRLVCLGKPVPYALNGPEVLYGANPETVFQPCGRVRCLDLVPAWLSLPVHGRPAYMLTNRQSAKAAAPTFSQPAARSGSNPHQSHSTRASPRGACSALSPGILLKTVNSPQSVAGYEMERRHRGLWLCLHRYALLPRTARVSECGCDAVVLGCTELPLVLNDSNHRCALLTQRGF